MYNITLSKITLIKITLMQIRYTSEEDSIQNVYCKYHTNEDHTKEHHTDEDSNEGHLRTCRWLRRLHTLARDSSHTTTPNVIVVVVVLAAAAPAAASRHLLLQQRHHCRVAFLAGKVQRRLSILQGARQGARGSGRGREGK